MASTAEKFTLPKDDQGRFIFESTLPPGIRIGESMYGLALFTTQDFKKGDLIFTGRNTLFPNGGDKVCLRISGKEFEIDRIIHAFELGSSGVKLFSSFDSFVNHSCDRMAYYTNFQDHDFGNTEDCIALRDIASGEQLFANYNTFEWDDTAKGIDKCSCGSPECVGHAKGMKYLTLEQQIKLLSRATFFNLLEWSKQHPELTYLGASESLPMPELAIPSGVCVAASEGARGGHVLVALENFDAGTVLYITASRMLQNTVSSVITFKESSGDPISCILAPPTQKRHDSMWEARCWDSFRARSEEPNTETVIIEHDPFPMPYFDSQN